MTVSAENRLMPRPPARVESMKRNLIESGALNSAIISSRSAVFVVPSSRQYSCLRKSAKRPNVN